ncbi:MAG TPA: NADP-dependent oxidoreductase [Verrucomicrobiae bacterium]|nr:NADP-dependent oxidoreductase [Verrucomicrobiae bacterium]
MKAAQMTDYGDPSVIAINEVDKPTVVEGQVLVEVHAASLNPWDTKVREGAAKSFMPLEFPVTAAGDIAGVVAAVGGGVSHVKVGDKVYGSAGVKAGSGALAEFAVAPGGQVAKAPANQDFEQAAALVLVGIAAVQGLTQHIGLKSGQKILIHGGAGGIGSIAIQIAKHLGAIVATTASADSFDFVKELGADEVIDYKTQQFQEIIRDYDAVFDMAGGDVVDKSISVLKPGGILVSMTTAANEEKVAQQGIVALVEQAHATTALLDELRGLVEAGVVKVHVDKVFSLDQAAAAFRFREAGGIKGKVVISIKP